MLWGKPDGYEEKPAIPLVRLAVSRSRTPAVHRHRARTPHRLPAHPQYASGRLTWNVVIPAWVASDLPGITGASNNSAPRSASTDTSTNWPNRSLASGSSHGFTR